MGVKEHKDLNHWYSDNIDHCAFRILVNYLILWVQSMYVILKVVGNVRDGEANNNLYMYSCVFSHSYHMAVVS